MGDLRGSQQAFQIPFINRKRYAKIEPRRPGQEENAKTDLVVRAYRENLHRARVYVNRFLKQNGFQPNKVNQKRRRWFRATYPLHVAVKQNDPYICSILLMFGADIELKDTWGYHASDYFKKNTDPKVIEVFERHVKYQISLHPPLLGRHKLQYSPPPRGFEKFFADLEQDPLVQVPNCESQWLLLRGAKNLREF